ncbi:fibronectin type III domain-containing protein [Rarobacter incanus]|uniref:Fibronectin type-III domain-containing protein n=1 Tax=Rarobacter incanus TaxID=153494 RepID=A0A542SQM9_9MICO|nr:fibronectin type III domain-containing protein [Rarobacter incanus]TQK76920.1 hypothetical protein FB389_1622 [Rarobacter incanus]
MKPVGAVTGSRARGGPGKVKVTWTGTRSGRAARYSVTVGAQRRELPGNARSATFTGLTNGVKVTGSIVAVDSSGKKGPQAKGTVTPVGKPRPVRRLKMVFKAKGRAVVTWRPPASRAAAPVSRIEVRSGSKVVRLKPKAEKWIAKGQRKGRTYVVKVRAVGAAGASKWVKATAKRAVR